MGGIRRRIRGSLWCRQRRRSGAQHNCATSTVVTSNASSNAGSTSDRDGTNTGTSTSKRTTDDDTITDLLSLAMSPKDRRALEHQMRQQTSHPTHRRMQDEAEAARMQHAQEWYNSEGGLRSRMRDARAAELTGLLSRMSARNTSGGGDGGDDDDDEADASKMLAIP